MGFTRSQPASSSLDADMVAAIASDPEGYRARKKDLEAMVAAAQLAIQEATARRAELNQREQALNDREAKLVQIEKNLKGFAEATGEERKAFDAAVAKQTAAASEREAAHAAKAAELTEREAKLRTSEKDADVRLRHAEADRDAAAKKLVELAAIAASLKPAIEQISRL